MLFRWNVELLYFAKPSVVESELVDFALASDWTLDIEQNNGNTFIRMHSSVAETLFRIIIEMIFFFYFELFELFSNLDT